MRLLVPLAVLLTQLSWYPEMPPPTTPPADVAEEYITTVLALGEQDRDYVDAYYGPARLREEVRARKWTLDEIDARAAEVLASLPAKPNLPDELSALRLAFDRRQLEALRARVAMLKGKRLSFDEESKALYDAVAPTNSEAHFQQLAARLEQRFPGEGPLVERYDKWRQQFVIPRDRLDAVFTAAIHECRARTLKHIDLPASESFTVEYVTRKSWSAYNWYQGNYRSIIQVNTDLPIYIDRAIDLACHEGYPGHHVYNTLLEKHLVRDRGWQEFTVYPLFSPQSLIAEGTANFGIEVAFPGNERVEFERRVLFPLAGLDPARAAEYYEVYALADALSYAGNEAARQYINGTTDRAGAVRWLERYALMPRERAEQRVRFFDQYRSYVINYNLGKDLVRAYIESRGGRASNPDLRWKEFAALISSPRLPSGLR